MKTMVTVAPEPKPSQSEDFMAFLDLMNITHVVLTNCDPRNPHGEFWRKGQAFFNALPAPYQQILSGSFVDPFYKDDWESCYKALDYLLDRI